MESQHEVEITAVPEKEAMHMPSRCTSEPLRQSLYGRAPSKLHTSQHSGGLRGHWQGHH
jgi:hypothetical protein